MLEWSTTLQIYNTPQLTKLACPDGQSLSSRRLFTVSACSFRSIPRQEMLAIAPSLALAPRRVALPSSRCRRAAMRVQAAALPDQFTGRQFTVLSTSEDGTAYLASMLAEDMRAGDAYCLKGDQGGGKSAFRWGAERRGWAKNWPLLVERPAPRAAAAAPLPPCCWHLWTSS